jgi:hypothetical protein
MREIQCTAAKKTYEDNYTFQGLLAGYFISGVQGSFTLSLSGYPKARAGGWGAWRP